MSTTMYDPNLYHLIPMEMIVPKSVRSETVEVLSVNWEYSRDGRSHYIPNLYVLEDQLIVDIFTILDGSAVKVIFEKYEDFEFGRHPVYEVHIAEAEIRRELGETYDPEIFLDGVEIMEKMQTGGAFKPWTDDDAALTPLFHRMKSQFPFLAKDEICFDWRRFGLPWTDGKKRSVETLSLRHSQIEKWCHIGTPFDITVGEKEHRPVTFVHPVTGITHTLYPEESELLDAREVWRDCLLYTSMENLKECATAGISPT